MILRRIRFLPPPPFKKRDENKTMQKYCKWRSGKTSFISLLTLFVLVLQWLSESVVDALEWCHEAMVERRVCASGGQIPQNSSKTHILDQPFQDNPTFYVRKNYIVKLTFTLD